MAQRLELLSVLDLPFALFARGRDPRPHRREQRGLQLVALARGRPARDEVPRRVVRGQGRGELGFGLGEAFRGVGGGAGGGAGLGAVEAPIFLFFLFVSEEVERAEERGGGRGRG